MRFRIPYSSSGTSIPIAPGEPLEKIDETIARVDSEPAVDLNQAMSEMKQFVTTIRDVKVQIGEHLIDALQQEGTVGVLTTVVMGRDGQQRVISASLGPVHTALVDELLRVAKVREANEHDHKQASQSQTSQSQASQTPQSDQETEQAHDTSPETPPVIPPTTDETSSQESPGHKNFAPWRT